MQLCCVVRRLSLALRPLVVLFLAAHLSGCCPTPLPQVARVPSLQQYQLFLVDWGYNTEPERQRAAAHGRIEVIGADEFCRLAGVSSARV